MKTTQDFINFILCIQEYLSITAYTHKITMHTYIDWLHYWLITECKLLVIQDDKASYVIVSAGKDEPST